MVQEETDRVKGQIKLSDINREFKMNREVKEYNNDSEKFSKWSALKLLAFFGFR